MRMSWRKGRFALAAACLAWAAAGSPASAEDKIAFCHAGLIKLTSFAKHVANLRGMKRYERQDIDQLVARARAGGPEFFSSQIIIQEEQSGSGTFDLRMMHGISDAEQYRNVTAWACQGEDYPIVYFVGFRVRAIDGSAIQVSREKDVVNVISLKAIDAKLDRPLKVTIFQGNKVLCPDINKGCDKGIFYGRE
jgi:hypothetical protein